MYSYIRQFIFNDRSLTKHYFSISKNCQIFCLADAKPTGADLNFVMHAY